MPEEHNCLMLHNNIHTHLLNYNFLSSAKTEIEDLYCSKWRQILKSSCDLDLD